jgi:hypothetical protein
MVWYYHALETTFWQNPAELPGSAARLADPPDLSLAGQRSHAKYIYRTLPPPPFPPYNGLPRPAWGGGWGWGRPQRVLYILYVQAGTKLSPDVPMKFIRESLGTRTPMERGNSKLLREPCVFWTPR